MKSKTDVRKYIDDVFNIYVHTTLTPKVDHEIRTMFDRAELLYQTGNYSAAQGCALLIELTLNNSKSPRERMEARDAWKGGRNE